MASITATQNYVIFKIPFILSHLVVSGFPDVEQLTPEREHTILIPSDHAQSTDGQRLGRVSLRDNQRAVHGVFAASIVSVV